MCATLCVCAHEAHRTHVVYEGSTLGVVQGTTNMSHDTGNRYNKGTGAFRLKPPLSHFGFPTATGTARAHAAAQPSLSFNQLCELTAGVHVLCVDVVNSVSTTATLRCPLLWCRSTWSRVSDSARGLFSFSRAREALAPARERRWSPRVVFTFRRGSFVADPDVP